MSLWERLSWGIRRQYHQGRKALLRLRIGNRWQEGEGLGRRVYPDYATYVAHQKTKLSALRLKSVEAHDRRFHATLRDRLAGMPLELRGRSVLCLAARQGGEVRAFIDQGAFAVGIDLNPGRKNRYVVVGDFHDLQFADGSIDYVYTNSLDHAYEPDRIIAEVRRVLKSDGRFVVEAIASDEGGAPAGPYEAMVWSGPDDLLTYIVERGFRLERRAPIAQPWPGEQLTLAPAGAGDAGA